MKALIKDNNVYCPVCESELGTIKEYKQVTYNGKSYTEFICYCTKKNCWTESSYIADIRMEGTIRFVVDEKDLNELKDEE